jgi:hypothetical protein
MLDIIHRHRFYLKHNILETEFSLPFREVPITVRTQGLSL